MARARGGALPPPREPDPVPAGGSQGLGPPPHRRPAAHDPRGRDLRPVEGFDVLTPSKVRDLVYEILSQKVRERFENNLELDTSHVSRGGPVPRSTCSSSVNRWAPSSAPSRSRSCPWTSSAYLRPSASSPSCPAAWCSCTGPTGSGKSTTLAALIDIINATKPLHIMSVEDPIEYLHNHKMAVVNQREVGEDTKGLPRPSNTSCARTPTSYSSVKCATWRRFRRR